MFGIFKKKDKSETSAVKIADLNSNPLSDGDKVEVLRYGMKECIFVKNENGMFYESLETGDRVSYIRMIDAATGLQKVKKIVS